jgi:hypothetical protein
MQATIEVTLPPNADITSTTIKAAVVSAISCHTGKPFEVSLKHRPDPEDPALAGRVVVHVWDAKGFGPARKQKLETAIAVRLRPWLPGLRTWR